MRISVEKNILITGVTGQLGSHLLKVILNDFKKNNSNLFLLVRGENRDIKNAKQRVENLIKSVSKISSNHKMMRRIKVLEGDITLKNLGLDSSDLKRLKSKINIVFHSAALADFHETLERVRFVNVLGTANVLKFVAQCQNVELINYISSAFIVGDHVGSFSEDDFDVNQRFNNPYEQSKFEAEVLVRNFKKKNTRVLIYRPSIIVGEFETGKTSSFQMFYQPLKILSAEIYREIPIYPRTFLNLMPVDIAAKAIVTLSIFEQSSFNVYHIVSPNSVKITNLIKFSANFFNFKKPFLVSKKEFNLRNPSMIQRKTIEPYVPYFNFYATFKSDKTKDVLEKYGFFYPKIDDHFLEKILRFAKKMNFIKKHRRV